MCHTSVEQFSKLFPPSVSSSSTLALIRLFNAPQIGSQANRTGLPANNANRREFSRIREI